MSSKKTITREAVTTICRLCETPLPESPVYELKNLPARIQTFPTQETLDQDDGTDLAAYQCTGCGHIQLASQPVVYTQGVTSTTKFSQWMLNYRKNQLADFVKEYDLGGKTILDVGCGDGHLLDMFRELGAQGIGVDASHTALEIAREHGHTAHYGYVSREFDIPDAPFDGFVCFDVIEHVPDIKDFVQGIARNLKPGAIGLLETPSFEKVLETNRWMDFMQDHIGYFTVDTLRLAFELGGFEVLSNERNRDEENLTIIAQKRALPDFGVMKLHQDRLTGEITEFINQQQAAGKRVAIWGASIQTQTLAATMSLDIAYVIDSAPYKQGKLTPVSHIPIVAPDALKSDPVDVIIVNAPRYHKEIVKQIHEKEQFRGEVVSLLNGTLQPIQERE